MGIFWWVPTHLRRFHHSGQAHFITFSCYQRAPLLAGLEIRQTFEVALERVRRHYQARIFGYVVMPEHVHLLLSEPEVKTLAVVLQSLKQGVSRRYIGERKHFWQKRYYDFNVRNEQQLIEKLRYIHRNPVKRGLCIQPEDWKSSSFLHYATGTRGTVEIESEWTARLREREPARLRPAALPTNVASENLY